jgi:ribose transport system permease protein
MNTANSPATAVPTSTRRRFHFSVRELGTLIGLILIGLVFSFLTPIFLVEANLVNILQQSTINACIALGMTLVIISGGIDLSVGSVAALSAVISTTMMVHGVPVPLAVVVGLGIGAVCGVANGTLITLGLQPFIVTLGTLSLFRALALIYTGGNPIFGVPAAFRAVLSARLFIFPSPVVIVFACAVIAWVMLRKTPLGEYILAVGGNEEAARVCGVPIKLTKVVTYAINGFLAALGAQILVGRLGAAEPVLGNLWELDAIAAAAIGGASLSGGKGSIVGTLIGSLILGTLRNGLTLLNVQAFYQLLATGIIIIVAMFVDKFARGKS